MKLSSSTFKKYLCVCSFLALQVAGAQNAFATIDMQGTATPPPTAGNDIWFTSDLYIGDLSGDTTISATGNASVTGNNVFQMNASPFYKNQFTIDGSGTRLTTGRTIIESGNNTLNIRNGSVFTTNTGFQNAGNVVMNRAEWRAGGGANVVGVSPTERATLSLRDNTRVSMTGSLNFENAIFNLDGSSIALNYSGANGALYASNTNINLNNVRQGGFTTRIAEFGAGAGGDVGIDMRNSYWRNIGNMLLDSPETFSLYMVDSFFTNDGDIIGQYSGTPSDIRIAGHRTRLTARNIILDPLTEVFRLDSYANSRFEFSEDLILNSTGSSRILAQSGGVIKARDLFVGGAAGGRVTITADSGGSLNFVTGHIGANDVEAVLYSRPQSTVTFTDKLFVGRGDIVTFPDATINAPLIEFEGIVASGITILDAVTPNFIGAFNVDLVDLGAGASYIYFGHSNSALDADGVARSGQAYQFRSDVIGAGTVSNIRGDTSLSGDYTGFTGNIRVQGGTLFIAPNAVTNGTNNFVATNRGILNFDGGTRTIGNLTSAGGHVTFGDGLATVVTVNDYTASGLASMALESGFANQPGLTDKLVVLGNTSGTTYLRVRDVERTGAESDDGIEIIQVQGASNGNFILMGDYTLPDGQQAVTHGVYSYVLERGANTARAYGPNNWYLRRASSSAGGGAVYQPATSVYEVYPQALLELSRMPALDERQAHKEYTNGLSAGDAPGELEGPAFWSAVEGRHVKVRAEETLTSTTYKQNSAHVRFGVDAPVYAGAEGNVVAGASVHYVHGNTNTSGGDGYGDGRIKTNGFGITPTVTWYGNNGVYVDGQAMVARYDSDLRSDAITVPLSHDHKSTGYAVSGEVGKWIPLGKGWDASLQAQMVYGAVHFNTLKDDLGAARVKSEHAESLRGRLGAKVSYSTGGDGVISNYFGGVNLYNQFLSPPKVAVYDSFGGDPVSFRGVKEKTWGGVTGGASYRWNDNAYQIYGTVGASTPFAGFGDSYTLRGNVGVKVAF